MAKFRETASSSLEICQMLPYSWQFYNQIWVICHVTKKIKTKHFFRCFLKGKLSGLHQASRTQQELLFWINSETEFPLSQSHTALHVCDFKENSPYCMVSFSQWGANIRCEHYQICVKKSWSELCGGWKHSLIGIQRLDKKHSLVG